MPRNIFSLLHKKEKAPMSQLQIRFEQKANLESDPG
jgi:hypothetical protein